MSSNSESMCMGADGCWVDGTPAELPPATRDIVDRCVGCVLGAMAGDMLGAACEGMPAAQIAARGGYRNYEPASPMGLEFDPPRSGMYTDDSNGLLSLLASLRECNWQLVPEHAALSCAEFWASPPRRGYPESASAVFRKLLNPAVDFRETGRLAFPTGSFANGGAMRIAPMGLWGRCLSALEFRAAVADAIVSTHVHPEAIDGAVVQAAAVRYCALQADPCAFDKVAFLAEMRSWSQTPALIERLDELCAQVGSASCPEDGALLSRLVAPFQVKAVDAVTVMCWMVAQHARTPEEAVIRTVGLGGDTDTTACMVSAVVGALHGCGWLPPRWTRPMENGPRGRDTAIRLATQLGQAPPARTYPARREDGGLDDTQTHALVAAVRSRLPPADVIRR
eukprot:gnl/Spiro4/6173_TR3172_c0_g1_i1.p1 gnl/Spiro4/6173_TR3172_c0_g1~~gnl/Spiro4/6173_TR3172_c0_g1_i1.p1  ORF type:complete len:410 (-),score=86.90 gnl/Spiro4/6173_TR3172_c0_g1_i1:62-1246(-)